MATRIRVSMSDRVINETPHDARRGGFRCVLPPDGQDRGLGASGLSGGVRRDRGHVYQRGIRCVLPPGGKTWSDRLLTSVTKRVSATSNRFRW